MATTTRDMERFLPVSGCSLRVPRRALLGAGLASGLAALLKLAPAEASEAVPLPDQTTGDVLVYVLPLNSAREVYRAEDAEQAIAYIEQFNSCEAEQPTGHIAAVNLTGQQCSGPPVRPEYKEPLFEVRMLRDGREVCRSITSEGGARGYLRGNGDRDPFVFECRPLKVLAIDDSGEWSTTAPEQPAAIPEKPARRPSKRARKRHATAAKLTRELPDGMTVEFEPAMSTDEPGSKGHQFSLTISEPALKDGQIVFWAEDNKGPILPQFTAAIRECGEDFAALADEFTEFAARN